LREQLIDLAREPRELPFPGVIGDRRTDAFGLGWVGRRNRYRVRQLAGIRIARDDRSHLGIDPLAIRRQIVDDRRYARREGIQESGAHAITLANRDCHVRDLEQLVEHLALDMASEFDIGHLVGQSPELGLHRSGARNDEPVRNGGSDLEKPECFDDQIDSHIAFESACTQDHRLRSSRRGQQERSGPNTKVCQGVHGASFATSARMSWLSPVTRSALRNHPFAAWRWNVDRRGVTRTSEPTPSGPSKGAVAPAGAARRLPTSRHSSRGSAR